MFTIRIADTGTVFPCAPDDTITRAGLRADIAMPYECNTGSCGSCKMELVSGEIESLRPDGPGLAERDRAKRRVLGCQAQPRSDCVIRVRVDAAAPRVPRPAHTPATLAAVRDITHDIREFSFDLPEPTPFHPGQYALLRVPGVTLPRPYSMSNINGTTRWEFQIKRVAGGQVTGVLFDQLEVGDQVSIDGPFGHAYLRTDAPRDVVCIAGGSGIAPAVSIARGIAGTPALDARHVYFFYGGRTPADICGHDVLQSLPGLQGRHTYIPVISSPEDSAAAAWQGRTGLVHEAVADVLVDGLPAYEFYFAGPPAMALAVQTLLMQAKVPHAQLHFDSFY